MPRTTKAEATDITAVVTTSKNVKFSEIFIPDDENVRSRLTKIEELAESIATHGLQTALTVSNGEAGDKPYRLMSGYRRAAALVRINWGDAMVPVVIVPAVNVAIKNLVENIQRENLHSADIAQRLHYLETGEYAGQVERDDSGKAKRFTKKELAFETGLSLSHVSNLIRAHKNLGAEAKKLWRQKDLPLSVVFHWMGFSEEEQDGAIKTYLRREEKAKAAAKSKGGEGGEGEGGESEGSESDSKEKKATPHIKRQSMAQMETFLDILNWKLESQKLKVAEQQALASQIETLNFLIKGDLKRFPNVTAAEQKAYAKSLAEQEASEEVVEEESAS